MLGGVWLGGEEATTAMIRQATQAQSGVWLQHCPVTINMWCRPQEMARQACCCSLFGQYVCEFLLGGGGGEERSGLAFRREATTFGLMRGVAWLDLIYCDAVCGLRRTILTRRIAGGQGGRADEGNAASCEVMREGH